MLSCKEGLSNEQIAEMLHIIYGKKIYRLVNAFFKNRFSERGQKVFGVWLSADNYSEETEQVLKELWDNADNDVNASTYSDWMLLKKRLQPKSVKRRYSLGSWMHYAAMVAVGFVGAWLLKRGVTSHEVLMTECQVPYGESREILLPDSTKARIQCGSLLIYPQSFARQSQRRVYLMGEACLEVAKDVEKPFVVSTSRLDVRALGTRFAVQAYPDEGEMRATLEEGSIRVSVKKRTDCSLVLKPGEKLIYYLADSSVCVRAIDVDQFALRHEGHLIFERASFREIVSALERKFGVRIQYGNGSYTEGRYNVKFSSHETLEQVLSVLSELLDIRYAVKGEEIYIKSETSITNLLYEKNILYTSFALIRTVFDGGRATECDCLFSG